MRSFKLASLGTLAVAWAALSACATHQPPQLVAVEADYQAASSDPMVARNAPVALQEARTALARADKAFEDGEDAKEVDHLIYLAHQRIAIARALADAEASRKVSDRLDQQRDAIVLDARTQEATDAREDADQAKAEARQLQAQLSELEARQTERGIVLTLGDVLFAVDRAELQPGAMPMLSRLATFLREHPDNHVVIEGHTDSSGASVYNEALSLHRAQSVKHALEAQGIDPSRISAAGFGASLPVASNVTEAGRQQNRRVEIVIQEPGAPRLGSR